MTTLKEWIEGIDRLSSFDDLVSKHGHLEIVATYDGCVHAFPQSAHNYRNVMTWVLLSDGSAVGWNESPRTGWSFPRTGKKTVTKYLEFFKTKGI